MKFLVIADSSPLIALCHLGLLDVLPRLFGRITTPMEVVNELRSAKRSKPVRDQFRELPPWIQELRPQSPLELPDLHAGEAAAISLALELKADLLLIDETRGRQVARKRGLSVVGTIGILEAAARRGWIDLESTFARLRQTDFWINEEVLQSSLRRWREPH